MRIYDLSPTVSSTTAVFPGDVAFRRNVALSFEAGHHLTLSSMESTMHVGTHADAPNHYSENGTGIDRRDPSIYIGPARVVRAKVDQGERVGIRHMPNSLRAVLETALEGGSAASDELPERLLIWTGTFPDPQRWNSDFASLEPELIEALFRLGVRLIGIDTPSIDPETSKALESHKTVARLGMAILEGLCLDGVPEGEFTLVAPPLKLKDSDASPLRALLLEGHIVDTSAEEPLAFTWVECEKK